MFDDYQVDENYSRNNFKEGEWDCTLVHAEERMSRNNNQMLVLSFLIEDQGTIYYYIVDDRSSEDAWVRRNQNLTRFFDCFGIQRGNFNYRSWFGTRGRIRIAKRAPDANGEQRGFEVKALIVVENKQQPHNGYQHPTTQRQSVTSDRGANYNPNTRSAYQPKQQPQNGYQQNQQTDYQDTDNFDTIPF